MDGRPAQSRAAVIDTARSTLRSGNVIGARQMLQRHLVNHPSDADALQILAEIAAGELLVEEATILFRRAVSADPSVPRRIAMAQHLQRLNRPELALQEVEQLPESARNDFEVMGMEATFCGLLGDHERQIRLYRTMTQNRPSLPRPWVHLAIAFATVGRTAEAIKSLKRAIRIQPSSGEAYWTLANLKSFKFSNRDIAQMREIARQALPAEDAVNLHFALGTALEARGEYGQSFRHYAVANALRASGFSIEDMSFSAEVDDSIECFTKDFFERNDGAGCPDTAPIFVIGLNRSGSTLVEQILGSHSMIESTAELTVMNNVRARLKRTSGGSAPRAIAALDRSAIRSIGEEYLEKTRPFRKTGRPYFVDKLPINWLSTALIRAALPNAKIIDARRHPMACGFSNFKQNYAGGAGYSYSLKAIGTFYRDYWRFMHHIASVQPGAVHCLINEQLIEDPEREVRDMLDYLGLPFEASCLEFHKNDRAVRTPSAEQVRRPLNRSGVDHWKHYEPWLDALKEALGPAIDEWVV